MAERYVADASPLIVLAHIGRADLMLELGEQLVVPAAVAEEVAAAPPADPARRWLDAAALEVEPPRPVPQRIAAWDVGAGESAVLAYVLEHPEATAVLDDRGARRCAEALGVRTVGTLGLLVRAKRSGLVEAVGPLVEELQAVGFRVDIALVREVLRLAGE